jgi:hypothetical protein
MLPLQPPTGPVEPGYPTRHHLLADAGLRRRVLAVLATAALSGCGHDSPPTTAQLPPNDAPRPALLGGSSAPVQIDEPAAPLCTPGIGLVPQPPEPEPAEPYPTMGKMSAPEPPLPMPLRGDQASPEPPPDIVPSAPTSDA